MNTAAAPTPVEEPKVAPKDRWFMIGLTAFEIGASILIVNYVTGHGGSDYAAYMWSLIPPAIGGIVYWLRTREFSGASTAILAFNLLSAGAAFFGSHNSKVLLYKDCFVTGAIGVVFLASLLFSRPLTFWFGQRFVTGGEKEALAWWDGLWQYPVFRKIHRLSTLLWAVVMFVEAGAKAFVIDQSRFADAYMYTQIIPIAALVFGIAGTIAISKHYRAQAAPAT